ncbi:hypothetical protein DMENIID0001_041490 [Sergentomyia squamirostris]
MRIETNNPTNPCPRLQNLDNASMIIIPVYVTNHWTIIVINVIGKIVHYLDPQGVRLFSNDDLEKLSLFLQKFHIKLWQKFAVNGKLTVQANLGGPPRQQDSYNYGVHCVQYVDILTNSAEILPIDEYRASLAKLYLEESLPFDNQYFICDQNFK